MLVVVQSASSAIYRPSSVIFVIVDTLLSLYALYLLSWLGSRDVEHLLLFSPSLGLGNWHVICIITSHDHIQISAGADQNTGLPVPSLCIQAVGNPMRRRREVRAFKSIYICRFYPGFLTIVRGGQTPRPLR